MLSATSSPIIFWNRPFFDLGPSNGGSIRLSDIEFSYSHLDDDAMHYYGLQVNLPPSFRTSLIRQSGLLEYDIESPLHLVDDLRTERWRNLCEHMTRYRDLTPIAQLRVINVLKSLSMHRAVLAYVPRMSGQEIAGNPILAALSLRRAISKLVLRLQAGRPYNRDDFEIIGRNAPSGSLAKISAALQVVAQDAKLQKDLPEIECWADVAAMEMQHITPPLDDFGSGLLTSIYHRAVAFVPLLRGDTDELVQRMDLCESHAKNLPCQNTEQQVVAFENATIVLQSRMKEAMWLGDLALAEERAKELVRHDPFDSLYHIELGDVLIKRHKIEEAAQAYHTAIRLGPPRTELARFMAGQCYAALGDLEQACDCYLACLEIDPQAISALKQLDTLGKQLESPGLVQWSRLRLAELQESR